MIKILSGYNWLGEIGENTKEVDECIEKGLLKYLYDESNPTFIILERNIDAVKEILNGDYDKFTERNILEWIEFEYVGCYDELEIENAYGNKIAVNIDTIFGLISDEEETYLSEDKKLAIYNAEDPADELKTIIDEIGREQAKIQIQDLLNSIVYQEFK
jgi:hypothetical protein